VSKDEERREFLKRLARGAVYSAPVIRSMVAPLEAASQGKSPSHKHHSHWGPAAPAPRQGPGLGGDAPGARQPPGAVPP
jgi:hypothetical protein